MSANTTVLHDAPPAKSLVRKNMQNSMGSVNRSTVGRAATNASKNNSFTQWQRLNDSEERENIDPMSSLKSSTRLVIQSKKPKELSIDLASDKKPPKE